MKIFNEVFPKGIVGGLDLTQDPASLRSQIKSSRLLVGVRHILDVESEDWLLREDVHRGLQVLEEENLVFDCLVRPHILKHVPTIGIAIEVEDGGGRS